MPIEGGDPGAGRYLAYRPLGGHLTSVSLSFLLRKVGSHGAVPCTEQPSAMATLNSWSWQTLRAGAGPQKWVPAATEG